jgi:two-component sensor histidine kinase/CheY-like chemotaxis protein
MALIHPEDMEHLRQVLENVFKTAQAHRIDFRVCRPDGDLRWCTGTAAASVDGAGRTVRMSGVTSDITERKAAEEKQDLLTREVDHRARNALAVVQSIVHLSQATTIEDYIGAVEGRIRALGRAHVLLSGSRWLGADLRSLVNEELAPYCTHYAEKIATSGPDVVLEPATAQALALALHELATNAAKYGALSVIPGRVALSWDCSPGSLVLRWVETGGPLVEPPTSQGYGSKVIRAAIERQLGGRASVDWRPEGLRCTVSVPRSAPIERSKTARCPSWQREGVHPSLEPISITGNRLLLVEDEGMVAMMISDTLADQGFAVIGPIAARREAIAAASKKDLNGAVLDVNLDGELIYPVAEVLQSRGVPFIFVTGYDPDGIDSRFLGIPVLQKPIERKALQNAFIVSV